MSCLWRGRAAVRMANTAIEALLLPGGGHIASIRSLASNAPSPNLLWEAPWPTADPGTPDHAALVEEYGASPNGPFFATYTGHALCLDLFGSPSPQEAADGISLHGEAAALLWNFVAVSDLLTRARVILPAAGLELERTASLLPVESVLRFKDTIHNLRNSARDFHWVQHASLGPPMLSRDNSSIAASVTQGRTWPHGYEGHSALADNRSFTWPHAPAADDTALDLRRSFSLPGTGYVVALQQDPACEFAYVAALNSSLRLIVGYIFLRDDFPWLTLWEENASRDYPPWNAMTHVRGLEFGSTPWPLSREESARHATLFGHPCARHLDSNATTEANWALFVAPVPADWEQLVNVIIDKDQIVLEEASGASAAISARGITAFLRGSATL